MIDTHAHLNFKAFDKDREEVIKRTLEGGISIINVGSDYKTSVLAVELQRPGVFSSVGLHPIHIDKEDFEGYKELAKKAVAIGETGLDYLYKTDEQKQKDIFLKHIELAKELDLPLIIHCRKAHDDMLEILPEGKGVIHCFTGDQKQAEGYIKKGYHLGFNGIIFKFNIDNIIKKIPLDRILLETDCPYLTPPQASDKRNEPLNVKYVAQRMSEIKKEPLVGIIEKTTKNANKLFSLI